MAEAIRKPVRDGLYQAVGAIVDKTAKIYGEKTGRPLDGKALSFVKEVVMGMIGLIDEAITSGKPLDPKTLAKLAISRALQVTGLMADERSMAECAVAVISLALSTTEVFGIMVGAAGISSTGAGAVIGVPVLLASATFYAYQVGDVAETCGEAYIAATEKEFAARYNVSGRRQMMLNYSSQVCTVQ